jgi:hypothetical protein
MDPARVGVKNPVGESTASGGFAEGIYPSMLPGAAVLRALLVAGVDGTAGTGTVEFLAEAPTGVVRP